MKFKQQFIAAALLLTMTVTTPSMVFAEEAVKPVTYTELSDYALKNNQTIKDLKETAKTLASAVASLNDPNIHYAAYGKSMGTTGERTGLYYNYAKMAFVDQKHYEAQLLEVETNIAKIETTINYQLQKNLSDVQNFEKQIALYKKKVGVLQTKYDVMKTKFNAGLVTKLQLYGVEYEMNLTKIAISKMEWQIKLYQSKLAEQGGIKAGTAVAFGYPIDSVLTFKKEDMASLYAASKQTSKVLAIENAKLSALENEAKIIETYKGFMLKEDIYEHQMRLSAEKRAIMTAENKLYRDLYNLLVSLENASDDVFKTEMQLQLDRLNYRIADTSVKTQTMIPSELLDYELTLNTLELTLEQKKAAERQLSKQIDALVNYGVYIEGGF